MIPPQRSADRTTESRRSSIFSFGGSVSDTMQKVLEEACLLADDGHRVVDFVGDTGTETTQGRHLVFIFQAMEHPSPGNVRLPSPVHHPVGARDDDGQDQDNAGAEEEEEVSPEVRPPR